MNAIQQIERSKKIRARYHELEMSHHGSEWTVEEEALAFLTDAGLVGRLSCHSRDAGRKAAIPGPNYSTNWANV